MYDHSCCKDNAIGKQSLYSDFIGFSQERQFDVRTVFLLTKAIVTKRSDCMLPDRKLVMVRTSSKRY